MGWMMSNPNFVRITQIGFRDLVLNLNTVSRMKELEQGRTTVYYTDGSHENFSMSIEEILSPYRKWDNNESVG